MERDNHMIFGLGKYFVDNAYPYRPYTRTEELTVGLRIAFEGRQLMRVGANLPAFRERELFAEAGKIPLYCRVSDYGRDLEKELKIDNRKEEAERVKGHLDKLKKIESDFITQNLGLVFSEVLRQRRFNPSLDTEEFESEGLIGLMKSFGNFDFSSGYKFSTYATKSIQRRYVRVYQRIKKRRMHKLDAPMNSQDTGDFYDVTEDPNTPSASDIVSVERTRFIVESIREAIANLKPKYSTVLQGRFGLNGQRRTLEECAREINLTKERARQIQDKALKILREELESKGIDVTDLENMCGNN